MKFKKLDIVYNHGEVNLHIINNIEKIFNIHLPQSYVELISYHIFTTFAQLAVIFKLLLEDQSIESVINLILEKNFLIALKIFFFLFVIKFIQIYMSLKKSESGRID